MDPSLIEDISSTFPEMVDVLNLRARDLEISEAEFCQLTESCSGIHSFAPRHVEAPEPLVSDIVDSSFYETPTTTTAHTEISSQPDPTDIDLGLSESTWIPNKISCNGILASGLASMALQAEDLESWSTNEIIDCIGILGLIEWPLETKLEVWKVIRTKLVR